MEAKLSADGALRLHRDIYPLAAIERAAKAFAGAGRFLIESEATHHRVTVQPLSPGNGASAAGPDLLWQFANYVLACAAVDGVRAAPQR